MTTPVIAPMTTPITTTIPIAPITTAEANAWITEHNRIRAAVGQAPVTWNSTIAQGALDYSKKCVFQHSPQTTRTFGTTY